MVPRQLRGLAANCEQLASLHASLSLQLLRTRIEVIRLWPPWSTVLSSWFLSERGYWPTVDGVDYLGRDVCTSVPVHVAYTAAVYSAVSDFQGLSAKFDMVDSSTHKYI